MNFRELGEKMISRFFVISYVDSLVGEALEHPLGLVDSFVSRALAEKFVEERLSETVDIPVMYEIREVLVRE